MTHFFDTVETIPEGMGFDLFSISHLCWLAALGVFILISILHYRKLAPDKRDKMRKFYAASLLINELIKNLCLLACGTFLSKYLPFHLCSINIFVVALHAWKPSRAVSDYLYLVCIPASLFPLFTPTWTDLPHVNFMVWHSFTIHATLAAYPLMLTIGGDIRPKLKNIPRSLLVLFSLAPVALAANLILGGDSNFMFLMYAEPGTPLVFFEELMGHHLAGFFVLIPLILVIMMTPILLVDARQKRTAKTQERILS